MKVLRTLGLVALLTLSPAAVMAGSININTANAEMLAETLDGVGPVRAEAIVEYREANGEFSSVEELLEVSGIGASTLESLRDRVTTGEE